MSSTNSSFATIFSTTTLSKSSFNSSTASRTSSLSSLQVTTTPLSSNDSFSGNSTNFNISTSISSTTSIIPVILTPTPVNSGNEQNSLELKYLNIPLLAWVIIGIVALLLIVAVIYFIFFFDKNKLRENKKKKILRKKNVGVSNAHTLESIQPHFIENYDNHVDEAIMNVVKARQQELDRLNEIERKKKIEEEKRKAALNKVNVGSNGQFKKTKVFNKEEMTKKLAKRPLNNHVTDLEKQTKINKFRKTLLNEAPNLKSTTTLNETPIVKTDEENNNMNPIPEKK
ncbi:hypothetical protein HK099_004571 [Clydaea vesicula]|uniref:Transmembrane protein n=1 Tax=Clydaea vesicula TaxID=447962 RepID=A0AAD5U0I3_9FUNG|nr:hypothetical protein HK099_004571 [Clydaea vesicula]